MPLNQSEIDLDEELEAGEEQEEDLIGVKIFLKLICVLVVTKSKSKFSQTLEIYRRP